MLFRSNNLNIIPKYCFDCFKIQIEPKSVVDLIKLFFIFDTFKFPKNNWRKCMVELREGVPGTYKGFIYCSSVEEINLSLGSNLTREQRRERRKDVLRHRGSKFKFLSKSLRCREKLFKSRGFKKSLKNIRLAEGQSLRR